VQHRWAAGLQRSKGSTHLQGHTCRHTVLSFNQFTLRRKPTRKWYVQEGSSFARRSGCQVCVTGPCWHVAQPAQSDGTLASRHTQVQDTQCMMPQHKSCERAAGLAALPRWWQSHIQAQHNLDILPLLAHS
jgi:hypothetical protein